MLFCIKSCLSSAYRVVSLYIYRRAWTSRGELDSSRDCRPIAVEILSKRNQQATMHGYDSYAAYATADTMAGTPAAVMELLERVWTPAKISADRERAALEQFIRETEPQAGGEGAAEGVCVEPWDWRYYAEKVRE